MINRILLNLMGNAVKFTKEGEIEVTVKLIELKKDGSLTIKLIVTDTGMGIPKDKQREIFEIFKRLSPAYEGIYRGSGLGLYIVKKFTDKLGGKVDLKSQVGRGATFTCTLPLRIATQEDLLAAEKEVRRKAEEEKAKSVGFNPSTNNK